MLFGSNDEGEAVRAPQYIASPLPLLDSLCSFHHYIPPPLLLFGPLLSSSAEAHLVLLGGHLVGVVCGQVH